MLLLMAVIEFGFLFNSYLAINFASREASLVAAEAGTSARADCLILTAVENSVSTPSNAAQITQVEIYRFRGGIKTDITTYLRGGPTLCDVSAGTSVPYVVAGNDYPPDARCNRLAGCPTNTSGVDQIGVEVQYVYAWHTPLGNVFGGSAGETLLIKGNVMRMEPVL